MRIYYSFSITFAISPLKIAIKAKAIMIIKGAFWTTCQTMQAAQANIKIIDKTSSSFFIAKDFDYTTTNIVPNFSKPNLLHQFDNFLAH